MPDMSDLRCTEAIGDLGFPESPDRAGRKVVDKLPKTLVDSLQPVRAVTDWTLVTLPSHILYLYTYLKYTGTLGTFM
jgi:hypothetical protein